MRDQRFGNSNNVKVLCVLGHLLTTFSIWRDIIFYKITTEALLFKKNKMKVTHLQFPCAYH